MPRSWWGGWAAPFTVAAISSSSPRLLSHSDVNHKGAHHTRNSSLAPLWLVSSLLTTEHEARIPATPTTWSPICAVAQTALCGNL